MNRIRITHKLGTLVVDAGDVQRLEYEGKAQLYWVHLRCCPKAYEVDKAEFDRLCDMLGAE